MVLYVRLTARCARCSLCLFNPLLVFQRLAFAILILLTPSLRAQTPQTGQPLAALLVPAGAIVLRQPLHALAQQRYWLVPTDSLPQAADRQLDQPFTDVGISLRALTHALLQQQATDTSSWQAHELPQATVVASRSASLPRPLLGPSPEGELDRDVFHHRQVQRRRFNRTALAERYLYQLSRPAFDPTGRYAAVLQAGGRLGMMSTRLLILAKRPDGWYLVGIPRRWAE